MILAKKVRLKPTEKQEIKLWKSVETARWAYNWALSRQQENYNSGGKFLSDGILRKELTKLKQTEQYLWLYDVSNNVTKQAVKDVCIAYKNFFKGNALFPKYKSKKRCKPTFYNDNEKLKVKKEKVLITKVGWIKTSEQIPEGVKYTNPRISFDGKYWYLSVGIYEEFEPVQLTNEVIGIDVGIKNLAICSNGLVFKNINKTIIVKKIMKRIYKLQREILHKYEINKREGVFVKSKGIIKLESRIIALQRRLNGIRNNHIHQTTNTIVKTKPSRVVMETLDISDMKKNKNMTKAIGDQKLYDFKAKLKYKCEKNGIQFVEADKWFASSKICSVCGSVKSDLKLSDRIYVCDCGLKIDRDYNASINLSKYKLVAEH